MNHESDLTKRKTIRDAYGAIAQNSSSCCGGSSCCGFSNPDLLAQAVGYSYEDISQIPDNANMGLSCGNPTAADAIRPGQIVLDLGCGGGFDVFIAARKTGVSGKVIGVDMTPGMIDRARNNAESFSESTGLANVEFRLGEIEHLPVADASVDVVISNCVINLSSDKPQVWREIARVLKPGGIASISDLALLQPLPDAIKNSIEALVGCVAGAVLLEETERMIADAGLHAEKIERHREYIDSMVSWQDPLYKSIIAELPEGARASDYITSAAVLACKKS